MSDGDKIKKTFADYPYTLLYIAVVVTLVLLLEILRI
jgi:hypothetical protein